MLFSAAVAMSAGCGGNTTTDERLQQASKAQSGHSARVKVKDIAPHPEAETVVVPENLVDRGIRRELSVAITADAALKEREISFLVSNGDVSVTGSVHNEDERKKINELAMSIAGVKSVANALRVAE